MKNTACPNPGSCRDTDQCRSMRRTNRKLRQASRFAACEPRMQCSVYLRTIMYESDYSKRSINRASRVSKPRMQCSVYLRTIMYEADYSKRSINRASRVSKPLFPWIATCRSICTIHRNPWNAWRISAPPPSRFERVAVWLHPQDFGGAGGGGGAKALQFRAKSFAR